MGTPGKPTHANAHAPRPTEADLLAFVKDMAEMSGWAVMHIRPARTLDGWRTPVQGSMGKGWPDLILARPPRLLAVELKGPKGKVTPEQAWVMDVLDNCGLETAIWRPSDIDAIVEVLR